MTIKSIKECANAQPTIPRVMCGYINRSLPIFLLLASCSRGATEYAWIEGRWISDAQASIEINPEYADLNENDLRELTEWYGQIKWIINDGKFTFLDYRHDPIIEWTTEFSVIPINSDRFKMRIESESRIVWRTASGFCTELDPDYLSTVGVVGENLGLECFEPAGT